ncbi:MAG TPA: glycosyltransferase family 1 protein [Erythrobacter sp.]|nr:glycosyltransferase family 1 protein [Sphingomonadaceae bacterium]MBB11999.1 glycosyltransferase family 1 protein [Sphingomonadaceae bacterium]HAW35439.1 glycosyltransferase family 1 protein [Erythrobacter sp.]|tara:strand:+ start:6778 stop:8007 length:1230 start_codon:yes stop_codon:yes gene_type:complete
MKVASVQFSAVTGPLIYLLGSYPPSLVHFRGNLIQDLIALGYRVTVGAPDLTEEWRQKLTAMGATVNETPMRRTGVGVLGDLRYYRRLKSLFIRDKPELVLTYTIKPNIWGALAANRTGVRSIAMVTGLGYAFTDGATKTSLRQWVIRTIVRRLYRVATNYNDRVIFQNSDDADDFFALGCIVDRDKARVVSGSGVDLVHYGRVPLPRTSTVLMVARLLRNKGVREYAEAAISTKRSFPAARFQLVGPFDPGPDSISRAELDGWIAAGLEYLGPVEDVRPYIAAARIYVLPSYREGTPRSVLEAMAMGRPVITTDTPGCRDTVVDGVSGLLVQKGDSDALAAALLRLLENPAEAESLGAAGFQLASRKYDVRLVNRDIIREIELLMSGLAKPCPVGSGSVTHSPSGDML